MTRASRIKRVSSTRGCWDQLPFPMRVTEAKRSRKAVSRRYKTAPRSFLVQVKVWGLRPYCTSPKKACRARIKSKAAAEAVGGSPGAGGTSRSRRQRLES